MALFSIPAPLKMPPGELDALVKELTGFASAAERPINNLPVPHRHLRMELQKTGKDDVRVLAAICTELNRDLRHVALKGSYFQCEAKETGSVAGLEFSLKKGGFFSRADLRQTLTEVSANREVLKALKARDLDVTRVYQSDWNFVLKVPKHFSPESLIRSLGQPQGGTISREEDFDATISEYHVRKDWLAKALDLPFSAERSL